VNEEKIPIIVGSGQLVDREATVERHIEPLDMLTRTARLAAQDAGISEAELENIDTVALVGVAGWHPQNAPGFVAEKLGAHPKHCYTTGIGGQVGVTITNFVSEQITKGETEFAVVGGCNNLKILLKAVAQNAQLDWARGGEGEPTLVGGDEVGNTELERKYGLIDPPDIYPLFENALRAGLGLSLEEHRQRMGNLFTRFAEVAASNPYAWFPTRRSAKELITVTPENRMIAWPYPKYLNAILNTEQAASVIVMSVAKARKLDIPEHKWIYWLGGADSKEQAYWASERPDFAACPSMKDSALSALHNSGADINDIHHIDFYSCFPAAVQMACKMVGIPVDDPRGFTVTGGLPYAGGPASAYTLHSIAGMVNRLQGQSSEKGLVTGNGWFLTKHSAAVLSTDPHPSGQPINGLMSELPSQDMVKKPCVVNEQASGRATVETYTVRFDRDGEPARGIVLGRTEAGDRFMANTNLDANSLKEFLTRERVGSEGKVSYVDGMSIFSPG
jgi:acetyl-CoA C-acetyltransferase